MFIIYNRCVIISGSPVCCNIELSKSDYIIACDKGYQHAQNFNITPNIILGDFDSYDGDFDSNIEIITAPCHKDDTDTLLGVKYGLSKGFDNFLLLGATKGRLDHQMANFSTCAFIASQGASCQMIDNENYIYAIKDSKLVLDKKENWSVSVFSFTDTSIGVTLKGLKYTLDNATLTNLFPTGVSNEFEDDIASIEVKSGILLVIVSSLDKEKSKTKEVSKS
ncbi:MAG: thiamine diphosphokinase [Oscillospiraceae bacterium]